MKLCIKGQGKQLKVVATEDLYFVIYVKKHGVLWKDRDDVAFV